MRAARENKPLHASRIFFRAMASAIAPCALRAAAAQ
jgi:hypothetical protein